jgi:hypothetical protein
MKFKVGDIVTGTQDSIYGVTNWNMAKGKVIAVRVFKDKQVLDIEVLEHIRKSNNGMVYDNLYAQHFELVKDEPKELELIESYTMEYDSKLKGTFITINEKYILFVDVPPQEIGISNLNETVSPVEVAKALALYRANK